MLAPKREQVQQIGMAAALQLVIWHVPWVDAQLVGDRVHLEIERTNEGRVRALEGA